MSNGINPDMPRSARFNAASVGAIVNTGAALPRTSTSPTIGETYVHDPDAAQYRDDARWIATTQQAFHALKTHDARKFIQTLSHQGVDVRGLPGTNGLDFTHFDYADIQRELTVRKARGTFYHQVFAAPHPDRNRLLPDGNGKVRQILLGY